MSIGLIILGVVIFLMGLLTPLSDLFTLPLSVILVVVGIIRLIQRNK